MLPAAKKLNANKNVLSEYTLLKIGTENNAVKYSFLLFLIDLDSTAIDVVHFQQPDVALLLQQQHHQLLALLLGWRQVFL